MPWPVRVIETLYALADVAPTRVTATASSRQIRMRTMLVQTLVKPGTCAVRAKTQERGVSCVPSDMARALRSTLISLAVLACVPAGAAADLPGLAKTPAPSDPQSWVLPADMTWSDYRPIPGFDWADPKNQPPKKLRAALILGDYSDRSFLVNQPEGSDPIANPRGIGGVPTPHVGEFYKNLLNSPQALNHYH